MRNADIFFEHESWKGPLAWSAALHAAFFGVVLLYAAVIGSLHGESWGGTEGGGGAMSVTLVSRAAVPLPPPSEESQNICQRFHGLESEKWPPEKAEVALPSTRPLPELLQRRWVE
jgi:hypothetical protein